MLPVDVVEDARDDSSEEHQFGPGGWSSIGGYGGDIAVASGVTLNADALHWKQR